MQLTFFALLRAFTAFDITSLKLFRAVSHGALPHLASLCVIPGPSNENFLSDLNAAHIDSLPVDRSSFLRRLQTPDTPCVPWSTR